MNAAPRTIALPPGARTELVAGLALHTVLLAVLVATTPGEPAGWSAALVGGTATTGVLTRGLARRRADAFGPANAVTLVRAALVAGVAAMATDAFAGTAHVAALVLLAGVALLLDGVDGRVARRTGSVSALGARFDMEVDAALILVLSGVAAHSFGSWVLAIGAARYVFVAAALALPWLREPSPPRYWCKVVAAIQGIALATAVSGVLPGPVAGTALVVALALLAESFGREVWWLSRRPGAAPMPAALPVLVLSGRPSQ